MAVQISDNEKSSRYEAVVDGEPAGHLEYVRHDGLIALPHTEVHAAYRGSGVAGALVRHALDAARADGVKVDPLCPYVKGWLARHPEYRDLIETR